MKKLFLKIKSCSDCVYCKLDYYESIYKKSGYECTHPDSPQKNRIADRFDESIHIEGYFPSWCPLDDV